MNITDKPFAAAGLTSYRYKGQYGWIMVGAKNHHDALREVCRSISTGPAIVDYLQVWDLLAGQYVNVQKGA